MASFLLHVRDYIKAQSTEVGVSNTWYFWCICVARIIIIIPEVIILCFVKNLLTSNWVSRSYPFLLNSTRELFLNAARTYIVVWDPWTEAFQ